MITALFGFGVALLMFALVGEADTEWLRILGAAMALIFVINAAIIGYQSTKRK